MTFRNDVQLTFCKALLVLLVGLSFSESSAQEIADFSLEELMDIDLYSASGREEPLLKTAAAAFVLSDEEIRRSGATTIPEALRLVPGIQVQRIDASSWSVASRGFGNKYSNKLLVLVDGRSIYNTGFSGVYWDMQDVPLQEIKRIEIVRGPGGAVWGANAVNGIINIITKGAFEVDKSMVEVVSGNEEKLLAMGRYQKALDDERFIRVFAKTEIRDQLPYIDLAEREQLSANPSSTNDWNRSSAGFKFDKVTKEREFTLSAAATLLGGDFTGTANFAELTDTQVLLDPRIDDYFAKNAHTTFNWKENYEDGSITTQAYWMREDRDDGRFLMQGTTTYSVDVQWLHNFSKNHILQLGVDYTFRDSVITTRNPEVIKADPNYEGLNFGSFFIQDKLFFMDGKLSLQAGSKVTYNPFSKIDLQPSFRVGYSLTEDSFLWAGVSRAVRVSSRVEADGTVAVVAQNDIAPVPVVIRLLPAEDVGTPESVIAYELGYRTVLTSDLTLDSAFFANTYKNLHRLRQDNPLNFGTFLGRSVGLIEGPSTYDGEATSFGAELALDWSVSKTLRLKTTYSWLDIDFDIEEAPFQGVSAFLFQDGAEHTATQRFIFNFSNNLEADAILRFLDGTRSLPRVDGVVKTTPSVLQLDLRFGWNPAGPWDFSIMGQNLLSNEAEYNDTNEIAYSARTQKSVFGRVRYSF